MSATATRARPSASRRPAVNLDGELSRARGRIRAIDLLSAGLIIAVGTLAFGLAVMGLDYWLGLSDLTRQFLLLGYVGGLVGFAVYGIVLPWRRQINEYYAARALERSVPDTKNGLVNWLDLRDEALAPAIHAAVQERAASEIKQADFEQAIPVRRPFILFFVAAALVVLGFVVGITLTDQIGSLLQRAFFPFNSAASPNQTRLLLTEPIRGSEERGDAPAGPIDLPPVAPGTALRIAVEVQGKIPAEVQLSYRYSPEEAALQVPLKPYSEEDHRLWTVTIRPDQVFDGMLFEVFGGDGRTHTYRVRVQSDKPPSVDVSRVVYYYPPYMRLLEKPQNGGRLKAWAGAKVKAWALADEPLKSGVLQTQIGQQGQSIDTIGLHFDPQVLGEKGLVTQDRLLKLGPELLRQVWERKEPAFYRLRVTNAQDRVGISDLYSIEIEEDVPPTVELLKAGQEDLQPDQTVIRRAANEQFHLEGTAQDFFGVTQARVRLRTAEGWEWIWQGRDVEPAGGRPIDDNLRGPNGEAEPRDAKYRVLLDLGKVTVPGPDGKPAPLQAGQKLQCWVEVLDNRQVELSDSWKPHLGVAGAWKPDPNIGRSRILTIEITQPLDQEQQKQNQQNTQQKEEQHQQEKNQNSETKPNEGQDKKPMEGQDKKPMEGQDKKPTEGQDKKPAEGQDKKPMEGQDKKPMEGQDKKPTEGQDKKPAEGQDNKPNIDPAKLAEFLKRLDEQAKKDPAGGPNPLGNMDLDKLTELVKQVQGEMKKDPKENDNPLKDVDPGQLATMIKQMLRKDPTDKVNKDAEELIQALRDEEKKKQEDKRKEEGKDPGDKKPPEKQDPKPPMPGEDPMDPNRDNRNNPSPKIKPDEADEYAKRRATDLSAAKKFRELMESGEIPADLLKKLDWSKEKFEAFRQDWKGADQRGNAATPEELARGLGASELLRHGGAGHEALTKTNNPYGTTTNPALRAPPELFDDWLRFTRQVAELERKNKKK